MGKKEGCVSIQNERLLQIFKMEIKWIPSVSVAAPGWGLTLASPAFSSLGEPLPQTISFLDFQVAASLSIAPHSALPVMVQQSPQPSAKLKSTQATLVPSQVTTVSDSCDTQDSAPD